MSETLQTILMEAEQQHAASPHRGDLIHQLLQQIVTQLQLDPLSLWVQHQQTPQLLAWLGATRPDFPDTIATEQLHPGDVRRINSAADILVLCVSGLAADSRVFLLGKQAGAPVHEEDLRELTDIFADLERRRLLRVLLDPSSGESTWHSFLLLLHSSLDEEVIASTIATDAAELLSARRIGVLQRRGRNWHVVATTGVSQPSARADVARELRQLAAAAAAGDAALVDTPSCRILPMISNGEWPAADWAVVVQSDGAAIAQQRLRQLVSHGAAALQNAATAKRRLAASALGYGWQMLTHARLVVSATVIAAGMVALVLLPAELRIETYGQLQPIRRQFVFAPDDGTVTRLQVEDQSEIQTGDLLCVLTNEDLEGQQETLDGELAEVNARLAAIDALRGGRLVDVQQARLLSAERSELQQRQGSLIRQVDLMQKRMQHLRIEAGLTGQVYGERLRQMLYQRPVQRGQYLFEAADPSAGWELQLRISEADVRYVLEAQQPSTSLTISYALETAPEITLHTSLSAIRKIADVDDQGQLSTLATAMLPQHTLTNPRPGTGVMAKIDCGQHRLGFVWFRKVLEFIQRQIWW